jgi:hypothetical protein
MGPTLKLFEVLDSMISFKTFLRTHGRLIYTGLTIEICFLSGSLDLPIAAHNFHSGRGSEALYLVSLLSLLIPDMTSFLGCAHRLLDFQQELVNI